MIVNWMLEKFLNINNYLENKTTSKTLKVFFFFNLWAHLQHIIAFSNKYLKNNN
jgi:hypothetical protein